MFKYKYMVTSSQLINLIVPKVLPLLVPVITQGGGSTLEWTYLDNVLISDSIDFAFYITNLLQKDPLSI